MILRCEVSVHAQPPTASESPSGELKLAADWATTPWGKRFDEAYAAISQLPRLYTEPDGSFAWTSAAGEPRWQLTGCLYDRGPDLAYIDLFGSCAAQSLAEFFACVQGPTSPLMVQQRERGEFVSAERFIQGA